MNSFSEFHGNTDIVHRLRTMLGRDRFPHAVILAGARGAGKYTLALLLARAMNCLQPKITDGLPDFCGVCENCRRIAEAEDIDSRFAEAVEAREGMRDIDKRETRILIQPHPELLIIPPDPPQMMVKVDQIRHVNSAVRYKPAEARRRIFIFTDSAFMKEAANALLKVLEEPPEYVTIFLLARNPGELLATIRSRSMIFMLSALATEEIEQHLAKQRPDWNARQRQLAARLSDGAVGRALSLDLDEYVSARKDALVLLRSTANTASHSDLFRTTEAYRGGAEGKEKTDYLLSTVYSLLRDLISLNSGAEELVRNIDVMAELKTLAGAIDFDWIAHAAHQLGQVQSGMRRNVLRPLSLDSFALALEK
jgi:DNA polymerase-3 subunit delta'